MRLPLNHLKIDRSFISGIPSDADDVAITRTIIAMAKGLDLKVIAEGVEKAEQMDFLKAEGCEKAQGFFFGRPVPPDAIEVLLTGERAGIPVLRSEPLPKARD